MWFVRTIEYQTGEYQEYAWFFRDWEVAGVRGVPGPSVHPATEDGERGTRRPGRPRRTAARDRRRTAIGRRLERSYDTIRDAILTCARMPTRVSLIYRTEPTTKNVKTEKTEYAQK